MTLLYSGWGANPAIQWTNWGGDLYVDKNDGANMSLLSWADDPAYGRVLQIAMNDANAASPYNGKVMVGPRLYSKADPTAPRDVFIHWRAFLPSGLPIVPVASGAWCSTAQTYGYPYKESPTMGYGVIGDTPDHRGVNCFTLHRGTAFNGLGWDAQVPWRKPVVFDRWHQFIAHVVLSTDPAVGLVELWFDGQRQMFIDGSQTLHYATVWAGATDAGPTNHQVVNYCSKGLLGSAFYTMRFADVKFGTSLADVLPATVANVMVRVDGSSMTVPITITH